MISIIIINYNTSELLEQCIPTVLAQKGVTTEIIVIDNASSDHSAQIVKEKFPQVRCIVNHQNLGYAGAANQGIQESKGEFVVIMNPDIILEPDYMEQCELAMKQDLQIAAITGKLYRYDFKHQKKTNIIDTVGLQVFRNRRIVDRGQGMEDKGQFDKTEEVFGISGACAFYRKTALEDIKLEDIKIVIKRSFVNPKAIAPEGSHNKNRFNNQHPSQKSKKLRYNYPEYFDNDFFMYKEDVDVSWRLRLAGWKCWYQPAAVAYHGRGTGILADFSHWSVYKSRHSLSYRQKYYAYRNQRLMQVKNEFKRGVLYDIGPLMLKEILIGGYILFRSPKLLKAVASFWRMLPMALRKRRLIKVKRKINQQDMQKWMRKL